MDLATRAAWIALLLVHLPPAAALFAPSLLDGLYGASASGDARVLLVHRAALFLAVAAACALAAFDPGARRTASLVVGISVVSFLALYAASGAPPGPLRTIFWVDLVALAPLALVAAAAWRPSAA